MFACTIRQTIQISKKISSSKIICSKPPQIPDHWLLCNRTLFLNSHSSLKQKYKHSQSQNDETESDPFPEEGSNEPDDNPNREKIYVKKDQLMLLNFANYRKKEKETFLECLRMYETHPVKKRELVSFMDTALKYMKEFGVHKDLEVYKQLIDLFPKEKMIPTNQFQTMFMHYPREQYCCVRILEQMEDNGVIPDPELEDILMNIFGRHGLALQKYGGMMYWMPKFKHLNPWPVPKPIPTETLELAKLAMQKISSIDLQSVISIYDTKDVEDSIDKTWIVSAMAPLQKELLIKHDKTKAVFVEGPFRIYVATKSVDYFTLTAKPIPGRQFPNIDLDDVSNLKNPYIDPEDDGLITYPCVHEQFDGTIFACCATGISSKDSLLSWIRCLQKENPVISKIPVIFTLRNYSEDKRYIEEGDASQMSTNEEDFERICRD